LPQPRPSVMTICSARSCGAIGENAGLLAVACLWPISELGLRTVTAAFDLTSPFAGSDDG
jgi:hypothetical protein